MNSHSFPDDEINVESSSTTVAKELILESSHHPSCHFSVSIPYNSSSRQLDLGRVLHDILIEMIPHSHAYQVFFYNRNTEYFTFIGMFPFQELILISEEEIAEQFIFVRINRVHPPDDQPGALPNKKKRVNDRTIKEVLEKVAEWRKIHQNQSVTLEEAAKMCNLPKKTLDDYFYQIRQAQIYGFPFEDNLNQKIGVLRKFVKKNHTKKQTSEVKALQSFMREQEGSEEQQEQEQEQA